MSLGTAYRELDLQGDCTAPRCVRIPSWLKGGRYEVLDLLASGGMGVLVRARDHRCGGNVVLIKSVKYDIAPFGYDRSAALYHVYRMRQQFKREKNVLLEMSRRGVQHVPNINDFFCDEGPELEREFPFGPFSKREALQLPGAGRIEVATDLEPYMVMERIMGRNLGRMINTISERRVLEVAIGVCHLLTQIHEVRARNDGTGLGFIYMDLKPDNLIVDGQGGVWLVDFGAAVPVVDGVRKGVGAYTPGFAAPEIRRAQHQDCLLDARADLYSLGALLFQALSTDRINPMELAQLGENEFPVLPQSRLRADIHSRTRSVVRRALSRRAEQRYGSAKEFRVGIEMALREV